MAKAKQSDRAKLAGVKPSVPAKVRAVKTDEKAQRVLDRHADGELLGAACKAEGIKRDTLYLWRDASPANGAAYVRARELHADSLAEEGVAIADDGSGDSYVDENGTTRPNYEYAARSRLRFDARKWYAATVNPKRYGKQENVDHTTNGKDIGEILRKGRERVAKAKGTHAEGER